MGMPARKLELEEVTVEDRLTKLESSVERLQSDVSEMKGDIRRLDAKIDTKFEEANRKIDAVDKSLSAKIDTRFDEVNRKFDAKFDEFNRKFDAKFDEFNRKFDAVNASIAALALSNQKSASRLIMWAVGLIAALFTARGFHWL